MELHKGLYRHYKGGLYEVVDIAEHSETNEKLVIYRSKETDKLWARPLPMFLETIEVKGQTMLRFTLIESLQALKLSNTSP